MLISSCSLRASSIILGSDHFSKKGTCVVKRVSPAGVGVTMSVMPSVKDILVTAGIEKLRRGPVTLGAFNVLVLEECARVGCQKVFQRAHQGLDRQPVGRRECGTAVHRSVG